jgi:hypothetical protein
MLPMYNTDHIYDSEVVSFPIRQSDLLFGVGEVHILINGNLKSQPVRR